ncbi:ABC transporter ATP-binding protein, partial [Pseudomonas aeruginosa]
FTLCKGESLSLIGHNGSGKSTLLQLVSGILLPSSGSVQSFGRVAPLIELGVGFHPELTGEENIYLNASLYGLRNKETRARFNDIADFSGLGDFIDTPVKNYSSGMYMRLGFSVAVHVEPQILLADEVLAVGDQDFQDKCYQRIRHMQEDGMALILVTHSKEQGQRFCQRFLHLEKGRAIDEGCF